MVVRLNPNIERKIVQAAEKLPMMEGVNASVRIGKKQLAQILSKSGETTGKVARYLLGGAKNPTVTVTTAASRSGARVKVVAQNGAKGDPIGRLLARFNKKSPSASFDLIHGQSRVRGVINLSERAVANAEQDLSASVARKRGLIGFNFRAGKAVHLQGQVNETEANEIAEILGKESGAGIFPLNGEFAKLGEQLRGFAQHIRQMLGAGKARAPKKPKKAKGFDKAIAKVSRASEKGGKASIEAPEALKTLANVVKATDDKAANAATKARYEINEFGEIVKNNS